MKTIPLQRLAEWMAVACAVTVFVAAALDAPDDSAANGPVQPVFVHRSG